MRIEWFRMFSCAFILTWGCSGCSSFTSKEVNFNEQAEGLVYFLPKKDVLVTVTVTNGKPSAVTLSTTPAYPDQSAAFVLNHSSNGLAKNVASFEIKNGLLTSSIGTTTSGVSDALKNLAMSAGSLSALRRNDEKKEQSLCGSDGNHIYRIPSNSKGNSFCGINVNIENLIPAGTVTEAESKKVGKKDAPSESRPGIYYRQMEGLLVEASSPDLHVASIVYVPATTRYFMPTGYSFFASNDTEIALEDGVPTKFKRDTDGEVIALLKLPADIISAYFSAVGSIFDAFKSRDDKEASALQESLKLEAMRQKYAVCLSAVKASDDDLISKLGCDK